jgi:hypothetical protein
MTRSISPVDATSLIKVSVTLGEYCLGKRAFVNCYMQYPQVEEDDGTDEWNPVIQHIKSDLVAKKQPSRCKRERFTATSQTKFIPY